MISFEFSVIFLCINISRLIKSVDHISVLFTLLFYSPPKTPTHLLQFAIRNALSNAKECESAIKNLFSDLFMQHQNLNFLRKNKTQTIASSD